MSVASGARDGSLERGEAALALAADEQRLAERGEAPIVGGVLAEPLHHFGREFPRFRSVSGGERHGGGVDAGIGAAAAAVDRRIGAERGLGGALVAGLRRIEGAVLQEARFERGDVGDEALDEAAVGDLLVVLVQVRLGPVLGGDLLEAREGVGERPRHALAERVEIALGKQPAPLQDGHRLLGIAAARRHERRLVEKLRTCREIAQHVGGDVAGVEQVAAIDGGRHVGDGARQRLAVAPRA